MVFHTVAWQYFPEATRDRCRAAMDEAGARAAAEAPLVRVGMEADGTPRGAALTATLSPGGEVRELARVDFHGRWMDWRA